MGSSISSSGGGVMAGNGGDGSGSSRPRGGGPAASISAAAATVIGPVEQRVPPLQRRSRWGGCFGGLSCFGSQKGGKRIVPASRIPDGNASSSHANGPQAVGTSNENTALTLSILAPPSSPASFTHSALPSTAPSPNCFLSISASSPGGPSSTMFATGPYANETQLVSPPVFSTFTTEPSTAPLTPPPELAHLTTPSSPDVPFARFLSSTLNIKSASKENGAPYMPSSYGLGSDLQVNYPLYPGSPSSSLISPASGTPRTGLSSPYPERDTPRQWDASASAQDSPCSRNGASTLFGLNSATTRNFILCPNSGYFYSATSAQFHLDQAQQAFPHSAGRLSISKEADVYPNGGNRHNKIFKQDSEEVEAYRASFGFSADEIVTTHYVEILDTHDESFTMSPFANSKTVEQYPISEFAERSKKVSNLLDSVSPKQLTTQLAVGVCCKSEQHTVHAEASPLAAGNNTDKDSSGVSNLKATDHQLGKRAQLLQSFSDAEIDYRRARSLREASALLSWPS